MKKTTYQRQIEVALSQNKQRFTEREKSTLQLKATLLTKHQKALKDLLDFKGPRS